MGLEEEILEQTGNELAREVDREILWGMLEGIGWHRVILPNETAMVNATAIKDWLVSNCNNAYEKHRSDFIFEDAKDANWFTLRWMN